MLNCTTTVVYTHRPHISAHDVLVSDTNIYAVSGIKSENHIAAECELTTAMANKYMCIHMLHEYTFKQNLNLLQQKLWNVY